MLFLKQSTSVTLKFGPFVDSTDGSSAEVGLTISQADVRLSKNGGDFAQQNGASSLVHDEFGFYDLVLDATDTGTLGVLRVAVSEAGALPVWQDFMVVPANVWDSFFGADKLQVHADEITAGLITAAAIATDAIDADALANDAIAEINATVDTALSDYDAPTKAELDAAVAPLALQISVDDLPTNAELTTALADLPTNAELTAALAALNDITVADLLAGTVEGALDVQETLRILLAVLAGKSTGGGSTSIAFRDQADTKNRIAATVDADGNRTAVTLDAS